MLSILPQTNSGSIGAVLCALIVVLSSVGLTLHSDFYAGRCRRDYWAYYTNQSNLLVFLYFALISPILYSSAALRKLIPHAEYALTLCIMLTHLVYHYLLSPFITKETPYTPHIHHTLIVRADSAIQHYLVPLLTFVYWLLCSPGKCALGFFDAFFWLFFPLAYLGFVFVRAHMRGRIHQTESAYPYPFLDIAVFGVKPVIIVCAIFVGIGAGAALSGVILIHGIAALLHCCFS